ncbi:hypothetical protein BU16DRAFT_557200 [Lophium mytilinum]|uniref:Uncharacterized protein n=1 Tax=Lophium mytilinum TaxID=390894 RepID=A0A6A6R842_9PEZI|nr:hypothetical protein BU16DRAFT_557200 [Lophium mytilinum]
MPDSTANIDPPPDPEPSSPTLPPPNPIPDSTPLPGYLATHPPPPYTTSPPDPSTSIPAGAHPCPSCLGSTRRAPCASHRSTSLSPPPTTPPKDLAKIRRESSARAHQESLDASNAVAACKDDYESADYLGEKLTTRYRDCKDKTAAGEERIAKALREAERNLHNARLVAGNAKAAGVSAGHEMYKAEGERRRAMEEMGAAREVMQRKGQEMLRWGKERERCEKEKGRWEREARGLEKEAQEWERLRHDWDVAGRLARIATEDLVDSWNREVRRRRQGK